mmetsp:Transcript_26212/g.61597  ORF Transcript_26212/g.61597 Transcript_26212/m.61597 type:complete len:590 (+) Transcript_26212:651-2420(+)
MIRPPGIVDTASEEGGLSIETRHAPGHRERRKPSFSGGPVSRRSSADGSPMDPAASSSLPRGRPRSVASKSERRGMGSFAVSTLRLRRRRLRHRGGTPPFRLPVEAKGVELPAASAAALPLQVVSLDPDVPEPPTEGKAPEVLGPRPSVVAPDHPRLPAVRRRGARWSRDDEARRDVEPVPVHLRVHGGGVDDLQPSEVPVASSRHVKAQIRQDPDPVGPVLHVQLLLPDLRAPLPEAVSPEVLGPSVGVALRNDEPRRDHQGPAGVVVPVPPLLQPPEPLERGAEPGKPCFVGVPDEAERVQLAPPRPRAGVPPPEVIAPVPDLVHRAPQRDPPAGLRPPIVAVGDREGRRDQDVPVERPVHDQALQDEVPLGLQPLPHEPDPVQLADPIGSVPDVALPPPHRVDGSRQIEAAPLGRVRGGFGHEVPPRHREVRVLVAKGPERPQGELERDLDPAPARANRRRRSFPRLVSADVVPVARSLPPVAFDDDVVVPSRRRDDPGRRRVPSLRSSRQRQPRALPSSSAAPLSLQLLPLPFEILRVDGESRRCGQRREVRGFFETGPASGVPVFPYFLNPLPVLDRRDGGGGR